MTVEAIYTDVYRNLEWVVVSGKSYWYENNARQGKITDNRCFSLMEHSEEEQDLWQRGIL